MMNVTNVTNVTNKIYPNCAVRPDDKDQWILYTDLSFQEVIAFFPEREDAEAAQVFFSRGSINDDQSQ